MKNKSTILCGTLAAALLSAPSTHAMQTDWRINPEEVRKYLSDAEFEKWKSLKLPDKLQYVMTVEARELKKATGVTVIQSADDQRRVAEFMKSHVGSQNDPQTTCPYSRTGPEPNNFGRGGPGTSSHQYGDAGGQWAGGGSDGRSSHNYVGGAGWIDATEGRGDRTRDQATPTGPLPETLARRDASISRLIRDLEESPPEKSADLADHLIEALVLECTYRYGNYLGYPDAKLSLSYLTSVADQLRNPRAAASLDRQVQGRRESSSRVPAGCSIAFLPIPPYKTALPAPAYRLICELLENAIPTCRAYKNSQAVGKRSTRDTPTEQGRVKSAAAAANLATGARAHPADPNNQEAPQLIARDEQRAEAAARLAEMRNQNVGEGANRASPEAFKRARAELLVHLRPQGPDGDVARPIQAEELPPDVRVEEGENNRLAQNEARMAGPNPVREVAAVPNGPQDREARPDRAPAVAAAPNPAAGPEPGVAAAPAAAAVPDGDAEPDPDAAGGPAHAAEAGAALGANPVPAVAPALDAAPVAVARIEPAAAPEAVHAAIAGHARAAPDRLARRGELVPEPPLPEEPLW